MWLDLTTMVAVIEDFNMNRADIEWCATIGMFDSEADLGVSLPVSRKASALFTHKLLQWHQDANMVDIV